MQLPGLVRKARILQEQGWEAPTDDEFGLPDKAGLLRAVEFYDQTFRVSFRRMEQAVKSENYRRAAAELWDILKGVSGLLIAFEVPGSEWIEKIQYKVLRQGVRLQQMRRTFHEPEKGQD